MACPWLSGGDGKEGREGLCHRLLAVLDLGLGLLPSAAAAFASMRDFLSKIQPLKKEMTNLKKFGWGGNLVICEVSNFQCVQP